MDIDVKIEEDSNDASDDTPQSSLVHILVALAANQVAEKSCNGFKIFVTTLKDKSVSPVEKVRQIMQVSAEHVVIIAETEKYLHEIIKAFPDFACEYMAHKISRNVANRILDAMQKVPVGNLEEIDQIRTTMRASCIELVQEELKKHPELLARLGGKATI